jgi:anti-anti-sigma regulatory factor
MSALYVDVSTRATDALLAPQGECFSHAEACRLFVSALRAKAQRIVIDLARIDDATTSAFAQLVLLRRTLRKSGRDLCLTGLHDRAEKLFTVNRLDGVLPRQ